MGFMTILAKVLYPAGRARRIACLADVTPVQNQPVMRVLEVLRRHEFQQLLLHLPHGLAFA
jgi:hypothetical protein